MPRRRMHRVFGTTEWSRVVFASLVAASIPVQSGCMGKTQEPTSDAVYVLYSSNQPGGADRVGIATFDRGQIAGINLMMCQEAADLYSERFKSQRFWCEKVR